MLTDFLKTDMPTHELVSAHKAIKEFRKCEDMKEWLRVPFDCWVKLEQFEEFLDYLVGGQPLKADTLYFIEQTGMILPPQRNI